MRPEGRHSLPQVPPRPDESGFQSEGLWPHLRRERSRGWNAGRRTGGGRNLNTLHYLLILRRISCRHLARLPGDMTPERCAVRDLIQFIDNLLGPRTSPAAALEIAWDMYWRLESNLLRGVIRR